MAVTSFAGSLNSRLRGAHSPITRYTSAGVGIGKGNRGHFPFTTGMTLQSFEFITTGIADTAEERAMMLIEIELNADIKIALTGEDIKKLMTDFHGRQSEAGRFVIPLGDMLYRTKDGIRSGELVTLPTDNLIIHVTLASGIAGNPTVEMRTKQTASQPVRYFEPRIIKSSFDCTVNGENEFIYPRVGLGKFIRRLHMQAADITKVNQFMGDTLINEMRINDQNFDLQDADKTPQANTFTIDGTMSGFGLDGLIPAVNGLKYKVYKTAAGSVPYVVEMLEQVRDLPVAA